MVPSRKLGGAASTVSCPMTMILCGWIVFILQLGSVFSCDPTPSDSCCPDEDECCNDGVSGVCCNENKKFYVPDVGTADECLCSLSSIRDSMCHFKNKTNKYAYFSSETICLGLRGQLGRMAVLSSRWICGGHDGEG